MATMALQGAKSDSERIFETELQPHLDAVHNFAYHLTYDQHRANDLTQETFLRAYRHIAAYETGTNAKAWLFTICRNLFINEYRRAKMRGHAVSFEDFVVFHQKDAVKLNRHQHDPHDLMIGDEVAWAINSLSPEARMIVLLCDIEDFSYEEIAKIAAIPIGTVRSRLHRARGKMEKLLRPYAEKQGWRFAAERSDDAD